MCVIFLKKNNFHVEILNVAQCRKSQIQASLPVQLRRWAEASVSVHTRTKRPPAGLELPFRLCFLKNITSRST